ncbi:MAG: hypothetical protein JSV96_07160 [Candidatus Aminicenantes bacterium]|nr:MAG: hypothetical protein JSV96_07160 [Candidatus Aminicenantes bacterium]
MTFKKFISFTFLPLLLTSFLFSQSVAELAKKEKERREKLKGKKGAVITNAKLKKTAKKSAVTTSRPAAKSTSAKSPSSPQPKSPSGTTQPSATSELDKTGAVDTKADLELKWQRAQEYVGLLTTKMNALWQEYYSMDDMTDRSSIQRQIAETFQKLQKAKEDADKAKKELDQSITRVTKKKRN